MSRTLLILTVALTVGTSCASRTITQTSNANISQNTPTPPSAKPSPSVQPSDVSEDTEKKQDVPVEFKNVDFKNFSYPRGQRKWTIRLKDGIDERSFRKGGGGTTVDLRDVDYADLTGDGKKEAVVRLTEVVCGGSCDGGSDLFYFFGANSRKVIFLTRIETGSMAYTCGLRSFVINKRTLVLESFRRCGFNGVSLNSANDADEKGGKFIANEFTRFTLKFDKRKFVLKKRELLPNSENDVKNYPSRISITNE